MTRAALERHPLSRALNSRGRTLQARDTAGAARALLANESVTAIPVLDGPRYLGCVDAGALGPHAADDAVLATLARPLVPTAHVDEPAGEVFARADAVGALRVVVLAEDGSTYRGIVCLRSDGERVCVDAECHADARP